MIPSGLPCALHITQAYLFEALPDFNGKKWFKFFNEETTEEEIKQAAGYFRDFINTMNLKQ